MVSYIVLRVRGRIDISGEINYTLKIMHLTKKFHATIIPHSESSRGMLHKVKDYTIWGPATPNLVETLLLKRGRLVGEKPVTEDYLAQKTNRSIDQVYRSIAIGELKLGDIEGLKNVFRLQPPRGGFKRSTKKSVTMGGETGYREDISPLILKMI